MYVCTIYFISEQKFLRTPKNSFIECLVIKLILGLKEPFGVAHKCVLAVPNNLSQKYSSTSNKFFFEPVVVMT